MENNLEIDLFELIGIKEGINALPHLMQMILPQDHRYGIVHVPPRLIEMIVDLTVESDPVHDLHQNHHYDRNHIQNLNHAHAHGRHLLSRVIQEHGSHNQDRRQQHHNRLQKKRKEEEEKKSKPQR